MHVRKNIKKIAGCILSAMLIMSLCACGAEGGAETSEPAEPQTEEAEAVSEDKESEDTEKDAAAEEAADPDDGSETSAYPFVSLYTDQINALAGSGEADQFLLEYIDDDTIPELIACSSEGSFDQDNTFIYTAFNDELVLLASGISGVDGTSISFSYSNMIRQTGSMYGMSEVYSKIENGALVEEFSAREDHSFADDAESEEVITYSVNGKEVSEKEYKASIAEFAEPVAPFYRIDFDGLSELTFSSESSTFEQGDQLSYYGVEDILDALNSFTAEGSDSIMMIQGPEYSGLKSLRSDINEDGTYYYEDMMDDGLTVITNMRYPNSQRDGQDMDAYAMNLVCAQVDNDADITDTSEDSGLSEKLTYPVYKISYQSGSNEDTKQAVGVVVLTDDYTYYYGYSCPIDHFEENQKIYESGLEDIELY